VHDGVVKVWYRAVERAVAPSLSLNLLSEALLHCFHVFV
jgi:hypothetical protein